MAVKDFITVAGKTWESVRQELDAYLARLAVRLDQQDGRGGTPKFYSAISMEGNTISNGPTSQKPAATEFITKAYGDSAYGPATIKAALQVSGTHPLQANSLPGAISATGSLDTVAKFTDVNTLGNSSITDDGTSVSVALPLHLLTALAAIYGGTGLKVYAVGDILYASTTTALSRLADIAVGNALISGGIGVAPSWGKIALGTHVSGTLPVANGGTNIASYAVGDLLYASGAAALSKLADVATGNALLAGGVTTAPVWGKIGLTTHVSGVLPIANGGTGVDNSTQTYTPTITAVVNVDATVAYVCQYFRVGNVVTVSGEVDIDPTAASAATKVTISLPIASAFASLTQCAGTGADPNNPSASAAVLANVADGTALFSFYSTTTANEAWFFTFTYLVV